MIRAISFDADGVLVDMTEAHYRALNRALSEIANYNIPYQDHIEQFNGLPTKVKLKMLINKGHVKEQDIVKIFDLKQKYTLDEITHLKVDPSKVLMLEALKALSIQTCCVTNSIRVTAEQMLKQTGLYSLLGFIISNEDVKKAKPDPEGYLKALNQFQLRPDEVLIVEDSPTGLKAAEASGCPYWQVLEPEEVYWENLYKTIRKYEY